MNTERMSVADIAVALTGDPDIRERMAEHAKATEFVWSLMLRRVKKGWDLREMAERMGISVRRLVRIEESRDADLKLGDVAAYARALGVEADVRIVRRPTAKARAKARVPRREARREAVACV